MKIAFFGTPAPAERVLDALLHAHYHVAGVVTQPDKPAGRHHTLTPPPVKLRALAAGIPILQPPSLRNPDVLAHFLAWRPDLAVVVAYGKLIPPAMLAAGVPFINLHFSLLPAYRGAAPVQHAILDGLTQTGVTIQSLAEQLDAGDIIAQTPVPIEEEDTTATLMERCLDAAIPLLLDLLPAIKTGSAPRIPQNHEKATLAPKLQKEDGIIHWNQPARAIHNRVRACNPWPGACAALNSQPIKIWRTHVDSENAASAAPGSILGARGRLLVAAQPGVLELLDVQPPGKPRMSAAAFVAGHRLPTAFDP